MDKPKCSIDGCVNHAEKRGWCGTHYQRWRKTGTTDLIAKPKRSRDDLAYFWSRLNKDGPVPEHDPDLGPCWIWTGATDEAGYGLFYFKENGRQRRTRAHRWILGYLRGKPLSREIVGAEDACHKCDNPPCCRPSHLYVGTRKRNVADAVERRRLWQQQVTHCPKGHEYTYNPSGKHRRCKECENAALRATRRAAKTRCKNGHPLEGDNIVLSKNGTRKCRICEEARIAKIRGRADARRAA